MVIVRGLFCKHEAASMPFELGSYAAGGAISTSYVPVRMCQGKGVGRIGDYKLMYKRKIE